MSGPQFFETRMGRGFYEGTMPALVEAVKENTAATARLAAAQEEANRIALEALSDIDPCATCEVNKSEVTCSSGYKHEALKKGTCPEYVRAKS